MSSLFEEYAKNDKIFRYFVDRKDYQFSEVGIAKLSAGRVRITSEVTREAVTVNFGALHFGEQNLSAGVRVSGSEEEYGIMLGELKESFSTGDFPETIRRMDRHFGDSTYSLRSLFRDEQRRVLKQILGSSMEGTRILYRQTYTHHVSLMRFLIDLGIPLPKPFLCTAEYVLNFGLRDAFEEADFSSDTIQGLLREATALHIDPDAMGLGYVLKLTLDRLAAKCREDPEDFDNLDRLADAVDMAVGLPFKVNLWTVQNVYFEMLHTVFPDWLWRAEHGSSDAQVRVNRFMNLGRRLSVRID